MMQCLCGSYAINHHLHGRLAGKYEDMCDVCYWRISHKALQYLNAELLEALENMANEFQRVYPIYYYAEPWGHETNAPLLAAKALIAKARSQA